MIKLFINIIIGYNKELSARNIYHTNTDYSCSYFLINNINKMRMIKAN